MCADLQQTILWIVHRENAACNDSNQLQKFMPTLFLGASAVWHHDPVDRRRASE